MKRPTSTLIRIIVILAAAAALRIWGLDWALPDSRHYASYHPDEAVILNAAMNVSMIAGNFDPGFYNYGSLYIFIVNLGITIGMLSGAINLSGDPFAQIGEFAKLYLTGRILAVTLGILTVYLVYALGRRLYGKPVGLLAGAFMAVAPLHVMHSKFMAVDVPATFFVVFSLLYAARIPDSNRLRNYILAGLFAGFAAATKYNAGLVLLSLLAVHVASAKGRPILQAFHPKMLAGIVSAATGFLIGCPGVLLNTQAFVRDFRYEMLHVSTGHGLLFEKTGSGFLYHLTHSLLPGLGPALLLLGMIGLLYALLRRSTGNGVARTILPWRCQTPMPRAAAGDWMLIVFAAAYYALIGMADVRFARYVMPLIPMIALLAARLLIESEQALAGRSKFAAVTLGLIAMLALGYTAVYATALDTLFAFRDTRDQAAAWIKANIPQGNSIGLPTTPWFYTPPLSPEFGLLSPSERTEAAEEADYYTFVFDTHREWNAQVLDEADPEYVIMSQFEYDDRLRVGDLDYKAYMSLVDEQYRIEKRFVRRPALYGVPFPMQWKLPHDMSYASPDTLVYARR